MSERYWPIHKIPLKRAPVPGDEGEGQGANGGTSFRFDFGSFQLAPTGTGFIHVTGGVIDPAARGLLCADLPAFIGDATKPAGSCTLTLATVNPNVGSFTNANVTADAKGRILAIANGGGANLLYWIEARNVAVPNNVIPAHSWTPKVIGAESDIDAVLRPVGNGSILAQVPDGTITAGNKRGQNAVDWQVQRFDDGSEVASGDVSVIGGGDSNTASGPNATVGGGSGNTASADRSTVAGGGHNRATAVGTAVAGGRGNLASADDASALGGNSNTASAQGATVSGGESNVASAIRSSVGGGLANSAIGTGCVVAGGENNISDVDCSVVGGGGTNHATGSYSTIAGGYVNLATGDLSAIGGGANNTVDALNSTVAGGRYNLAHGTASFVGGGEHNRADGFASFISGGWYGTTRLITGAQVHGNSLAAVLGSDQVGRYILSAVTTNATPTPLLCDGGAAGTINQVSLPVNASYGFHGRVVGRKPSTGDTFVWTFDGGIKKGANNAATALIAAVVPVVVCNDAGAAAWVLAVTADTTNGALRLTVTGVAATTIRWTASVETTENVG